MKKSAMMLLKRLTKNFNLLDLNNFIDCNTNTDWRKSWDGYLQAIHREKI